jgi:DNA-directed RNA polymerase specialized sigma24 family protein
MASQDLKRTLERMEAPGAGARESGADAPSSTQPKKIHWKQLLSGASPREVLARIMNGDPLEVRARVSARLRERALLFDVDRVLLRSFARTARFAVRYRGDPPLDAWLASMVDEALADLLREDAEAERENAPLDERQHSVYCALARPLGLDPTRMRGVCSTFNALPDEERRAFHAFVIEGASLDDLARARSLSASEVARAARRALDALLERAITSRAFATDEEPHR